MSGVRGVMSGVREDARRVGDGRRRLDVQWLAPVAVVLLVFACFFAIGRAGGHGEAAGGEPPAAIHAESLKDAVPIALASAPPLQPNAALEAIAAANQRAAEAPPSQPISIRASLRGSSGSEGQSSSGEALSSTSSSESAPESSPEPTEEAPSPTPAPVQSRPAPSAPAKSQPSNSGSSSGGGSFDTSG